MRQKRSNKKSSTIGTVIAMAMIAVFVITLYYKVSNKDHSEVGVITESDEVSLLLKKDIKGNYPATPREVVKLYLRIMTCYYNEDLEENTLEGLARQTLLLFDQELVESNPLEEYLERLKTDIDWYKQQQKVITSYELEKGSAVRYYEKAGQEYASLIVNVISRDEKIRYSTSEQFILRKDEDGTYKILGWQIVEDADLDEH